MAGLDFKAPLSQYFQDDVAALLKAHDVATLEDLCDVTSEVINWHELLGLDNASADSIALWLYEHLDSETALPAHVVTRARRAKSRGDAITLEKVGKKADLTYAAFDAESGIVPLELFDFPSELDGSRGTNRGPAEHCALEADNDVDAAVTWLKARANNVNTFSAYRKEIERFMLWAVLEKETPLSSLSIEQCSEYLHWLEDLGRLDEAAWKKRWKCPQHYWLGPKNVPRLSGEWRPFNSPLSATSRKSAVTGVRRLFTFLQKTGYLKFNPFDQISTKVPLLPGEGKPKEFSDRSLTHEQWQDILDYLENLPDSVTKARLKVVLMLGKSLGMRASEMLNARCGWIQYLPVGNEKSAFIDIVGKGDHERRLPVSDAQVDIINAYLEMRKHPMIGIAEGEDVPILASVKKRGGNESLSRSGLYLILTEFFEKVAQSIEEERPQDASKLRTGSTHWLRHTFAVTSLEVMPINIVQTAMGHASIGTTSRYLTPDQKEIYNAMKKKPAM